MALADYTLCEHCGSKAFYDHNIDYPEGVVVVALCADCSDRYELRINLKGASHE